MKLIKSLNLMENKKLIFWLNVWSLPLLLLFAAIFSFLAVYIGGSFSSEFHAFTLLFYAGILFVLIIIHELIHGLFFKLFHPEGKVKFGFKNGMAYATSPHSFYTKPKFACIILAPFVLITLSFFILLYAGLIPVPAFVFLASTHGASCIGDFYWTYLLIQAPKHALVEDTEEGINFYQK